MRYRYRPGGNAVVNAGVAVVVLATPFLVAAAEPAARATEAQRPLPGCTAAIAYADLHRGVSVLVLQDGVPVCQSKDVSRPHELWSGTKSFVGVIAAAAVQDGLIRLDDPVADTIEQWRGDRTRNQITIAQLLSMTSGHATTIGRAPGYRDALQSPLSAKPGERFQYGPDTLQIFGEVLRRKLVKSGLDENPRDYIERRLFTPLGITAAAWRNGPDGLPLMPQGAIMSAVQWAKFGEFVRLGGKINGRHLVDPKAFAALFRGSAANPAYGLTWWLAATPRAPDPVSAASDIGQHLDTIPRDLVFAAGFGDQRMYVIPSKRLTIVRQAQLDLAALRPGSQQPGGKRWSDAQFLGLLLNS